MYKKVVTKYFILKIRLKLSYMSMAGGLTLLELFCKSILKTYVMLQQKGVIPNFNPLPTKEFRSLMAEKTKYDIGIKMKDMFNKDKCKDLFRDYENQHQGNSGNKDFITQYVNMKVEITLKKKELKYDKHLYQDRPISREIIYPSSTQKNQTYKRPIHY